MTLVEIRQKFIEISGRYDLVVDAVAWVDNGADFFINAGQRLLDRAITSPKTRGRVFRLTDAGDYGVTFQTCRSIKEVWCADTDSRWELEKLDMRDFRNEYWNEPIGNIQQGKPTVYTPAQLRKIPDTIDLDDLEAIIGYADVMIGDDASYRGVLFLPPTDGQYQIEVMGNFYSLELTDDTHFSYWSEVHPMALVQSAMAMLEMSYRNTQGYNDAMNAITTLIVPIDFDTVDEDISSVSRMEG
jgi:hypothetical protein